MSSASKLMLVVPLSIVSAVPAAAQLDGDAKRGGQFYRECAACHALQPGVHTSGPSLAGLWGKTAGSVNGFARYSKALQSSKLIWNEDSLNAWIANPGATVAGTFMTYRGMRKKQDRADLIAFLKVAMAPGGAASVIQRGLVAPQITEGQIPDPLKSQPTSSQVRSVRHCGDGFFVTTRDGRETAYWEMNVRLKVDTRATGPAADIPVIVGAGMVGDRVSIVFSNIEEISRFVIQKC